MNVRRNKIGDAYPDFISLPPRVDIHHPSGGLHVVPLTQRRQVVRKPLTTGEGMQEGEMRWVHTVFLHLQPVARPDTARTGHELVTGQVKRVQDGEGRLLLRRPHVRKHHPTVLVYRISTMIEAVFQCAIRWLSRRLEDLAVHVEEPAVVTASNPLLGDQTKLQRSAAKGTVQL